MNERSEDDAVFGDRSDLDWIERLLDGADGVDRDDLPAACAGLADVLLAARAPASPAEFAGEAAVMAMFRSTVAGEAAARSPFARRAKVIAVAVSLGATAMTGAAAAAGRLPPDIQDMASELLDRVGIQVPAANRADGLIDVPTELPIAGRAGASSRAAARSGAGDADRGPSSPPALTRTAVAEPSVDVVDTVAAQAIIGRDGGRVVPADRCVRAGARRDHAGDGSGRSCRAEHAGAGSPGDGLRLTRRPSRCTGLGRRTGASRRAAGAGGRERAAGTAEGDTGWTPGDGARARACRSAGRSARRCPGQLARVAAGRSARRRSGQLARVAAGRSARRRSGQLERVATGRSGDHRSVRGREIGPSTLG